MRLITWRFRIFWILWLKVQALTGAHFDKLFKANRELRSLCTTIVSYCFFVRNPNTMKPATASLVTHIVDTHLEEFVVCDEECEAVDPLIENPCVPLFFLGVDVTVGRSRFTQAATRCSPTICHAHNPPSPVIVCLSEAVRTVRHCSHRPPVVPMRPHLRN